MYNHEITIVKEPKSPKSLQTIAYAIQKTKNNYEHLKLTISWLNDLKETDIDQRVRLKDNQKIVPLKPGSGRFIEATLLGLSVTKQEPKIVESLIKKGANPNEKIKVIDIDPDTGSDKLTEKLTPLTVAIINKDLPLIKMLYEHGAKFIDENQRKEVQFLFNEFAIESHIEL